MGIFDTPAIVSEKVLQLKQKGHDDFILDILFIEGDNVFEIKHDFYESPCYFKIISWAVSVKNMPIFTIEYYPTNSNILKVANKKIAASGIESVIEQWQKSVNKLLNFESLHTEPGLESIRAELEEKLGLTAENADKLIDDVQKKHAAQYCDQILEILNDLDLKGYDEAKIQEIQFDIEKIKRDIELLRIKTKGDLAKGITKVWGKIKLAKVGKYILDKGADGVAGKFIGDIIDKIV